MLVRNDEIKAMAKGNGVYMYEIADRLNVSEPTLTRWLRHELTAARREEIVNAITAISAEKKT